MSKLYKYHDERGNEYDEIFQAKNIYDVYRYFIFKDIDGCILQVIELGEDERREKYLDILNIEEWNDLFENICKYMDIPRLYPKGHKVPDKHVIEQFKESVKDFLSS